MMCIQTEIEKFRKKQKLPLLVLQEPESSFLHEFKCPNKNRLLDGMDGLPCIILLSRSSHVRSIPSTVITAFRMALALSSAVVLGISVLG